ncbi:MAG: hypothetical protein SFY68_14155 [Candidatus Sumerlaeia bacterium]|nr:hypothetical protein [Candidatus Sumerlaeia bacterium]
MYSKNGTLLRESSDTFLRIEDEDLETDVIRISGTGELFIEHHSWNRIPLATSDDKNISYLLKSGEIIQNFASERNRFSTIGYLEQSSECYAQLASDKHHTKYFSYYLEPSESFIFSFFSSYPTEQQSTSGGGFLLGGSVPKNYVELLDDNGNNLICNQSSRVFSSSAYSPLTKTSINEITYTNPSSTERSLVKISITDLRSSPASIGRILSYTDNPPASAFTADWDHPIKIEGSVAFCSTWIFKSPHTEASFGPDPVVNIPIDPLPLPAEGELIPYYYVVKAKVPLGKNISPEFTNYDQGFISKIKIYDSAKSLITEVSNLGKTAESISSTYTNSSGIEQTVYIEFEHRRRSSGVSHINMPVFEDKIIYSE